MVLFITLTDNVSLQQQSRTLFSRPWLLLFYFNGQSNTYISEPEGFAFRKPRGFNTSSLILYTDGT
jgi:hypothetical protein